MFAENLEAWLALFRAQGVGARRFWTLLGKAERGERLLLEKYTPGEKKILSGLDWQGAKLDLNWAKAENKYLLTPGVGAYPSALKHIMDPPPVLYYRGKLLALSASKIAIIGSRKPSAAGMRLAASFAREMAIEGCVVSGLALGIDREVHRAVLSVGGRTIAILPSGIDKIYPRQHVALAEKIVENGGLISEFPLGSWVQRQHFAQRNRIISGLSQGVLVIEAGKPSGTLLTAAHALRQGRELWVVPGSIEDPLKKGCHFLLKNGAGLVEGVEDIYESLAFSRGKFVLFPLKKKLDSAVLKLLDCIEFKWMSAAEIQHKVDLKLAKLLALLSELELQGEIIQSHLGYKRRKQ